MSPWVFYLVSILNYAVIVLVVLLVNDVTVVRKSSDLVFRNDQLICDAHCLSSATLLCYSCASSFQTVDCSLTSRWLGVALLVLGIGLSIFAVYAPISELINKTI